jgi:hypothetical protein
MVTTQDVKNMVLFAEGNPEMMKTLKNLNIFDYWVNKYRDFEEMLNCEYPALVKLWDIDLHCLRLYTRMEKEMEFYPGKAVMFKTLAEAHKGSILKDMETISEVLHMEYDDFFGLE